MKRPRTLRLYVVRVEGYDSYRYAALTASAARWQCFKASRDAGMGWTFRSFLDRVTTLHLGVVE